MPSGYRRASVPRHRISCLVALLALTVVTILALSPGAWAARTMALLGDTAVEAQHDTLVPGRMEAFRLPAHASGRAAKLRLYLDARSTATRVLVGLYRNHRRRPRALLATGSILAPRNGAWNSVALAHAVRLVRGRSYWLSVLGEGGVLRYRARLHGRCRSEASIRADLSALPSAWSASRILRHAHCPISAYASAAFSSQPLGGASPSAHGAPVNLTPPTISVASGGGASSLLQPAPPFERPPTVEEKPRVEKLPAKEKSPLAAPLNSVAPAIGGTLTVGEVLSSTNGTWSGSPTSYAYRWQDCNSAGASCASISGATAFTYTLKSSDVGHTLRVSVTATNAKGSATASSQATGSVATYTSGTPYPACTQTLSQGANVPAAVSGAAPGSVVCLNSGAYGNLTLDSTHTADVTLQAAPEAHVTAGKLVLAGSHTVVRGLWISGEVALEEGASFMTIDRDDITGGGEGIVFDTSDCTVPNAPTWSGCEPHKPITNVTISADHIHNIGEGGGEDAIHLDNWRNVTVTGNEFDHIVESGEHTDCLQSVYGGEGLVFDHNYEHDNDCQGFFIKDGDATGVSFTENLLVRDQIGSYANFAQVWNVQGLTIQQNTIWDGKGFALVANGASFTPTATIDHNVLNIFKVEQPIGTAFSITEGNDVFGESPTNLSEGSGDSILASPSFANTATDDYRLASNPKGIGIDWAPAEQHYGPAG
jgi:Right handed beta helix region